MKIYLAKWFCFPFDIVLSPSAPSSLNQVIVLTLTSVLPWHIPQGLIMACHLHIEINFFFRCLPFSFILKKKTNKKKPQNAVVYYPWKQSTSEICSYFALYSDNLWFQRAAFSLGKVLADTWPFQVNTMQMTPRFKDLNLNSVGDNPQYPEAVCFAFQVRGKSVKGFKAEVKLWNTFLQFTVDSGWKLRALLNLCSIFRCFISSSSLSLSLHQYFSFCFLNYLHRMLKL